MGDYINEGLEVSGPDYRDLKVLSVIRGYRSLSKADLTDIAVNQLGLCARQTLPKILKRLMEEGRVGEIRENGKTFYALPEYSAMVQVKSVLDGTGEFFEAPFQDYLENYRKLKDDDKLLLAAVWPKLHRFVVERRRRVMKLFPFMNQLRHERTNSHDTQALKFMRTVRKNSGDTGADYVAVLSMAGKTVTGDEFSMLPARNKDALVFAVTIGSGAEQYLRKPPNSPWLI